MKGQVDFLRSELDSALRQIQAFKDREQKSHGSDRSEVEVKILLLLAEHDSGLNSDQIAHALQVGKQIVEFHLNEFIEPKFVYCVATIGPVPSSWFLDQEGRRYLIKRGLLK